MSANNTTAVGIEDYGGRTFSVKEMAFTFLGLMSPAIVDICQDEPVFAHLNGGLQSISDLKSVIAKIRKNIEDTVEIRNAVFKENSIDDCVTNGVNSEVHSKQKIIEPRASIKFNFPPLPEGQADIATLNESLNGMVDLEKVVVITGFAKVGPWGNSAPDRKLKLIVSFH